MAISLYEFQVTMETLGYPKVYERTLSEYDHTLIPCFQVGEIKLTHSGIDFVEPWGRIIPNSILTQAMAKFGEHYLCGANFYYNTIHTIPALVVLALMLENRYSKELFNSLIDEIYSNLLSCPGVNYNYGTPFNLVCSPKMKELWNVIVEYDDCVNPFSAHSHILKPASSYLNSVTVNLAIEETDTVNLTLATKQLDTHFNESMNGFAYSSCFWYTPTKLIHCPHFAVKHYFNMGDNGKPIDEVINIDNSVGGYFEFHPEDVHLNISLHSELAWETGGQCQAAPATDEQINIVIAFLKSKIEKIQNNILSNLLVINC